MINNCTRIADKKTAMAASSIETKLARVPVVYAPFYLIGVARKGSAIEQRSQQ